jgi:hypothetical protein
MIYFIKRKHLDMSNKVQLMKIKLQVAYKNRIHRLIRYLISKSHWHNTILDSNIPNVKFLKLVSITVVNEYGQEHTHTYTLL